MAVQIATTTALVTGANRGIGRALVEALLDRGATRVYATARRRETLDSLVALGAGRVVPIELDVTDQAQVAALPAAAADVTLLINNAGVASHMSDTVDDDAWLEAGRAEFEVNVLGTLAVTQRLAPVLARNGGGAVVNIASVVSFVGFPSFATYAAAKAGTHSITQTTRQLLRGQGTFVAGVYPGPVDTDMAANITLDKASPREVAHAILDGLEAGQEDILPDPMARQMGAAFFSGPKQLEQPAAA